MLLIYSYTSRAVHKRSPTFCSSRTPHIGFYFRTLFPFLLLFLGSLLLLFSIEVAFGWRGEGSEGWRIKYLEHCKWGWNWANRSVKDLCTLGEELILAVDSLRRLGCYSDESNNATVINVINAQRGQRKRNCSMMT